MDRRPSEPDRVTLRDAFDALVDLDPAERKRRFQSLTLEPGLLQRLGAMLDASQSQVPILDASFEKAIDCLLTGVEDVTHLIGAQMGPFRILELLGEGGSSSVFRAERAAGVGSQVVALKLLRAGLYSGSAARRFQREMAILAQLDHPGIARLIEGGVTESGVPYIAMELVEGGPITHAADELELDLGQRLALFLQLCEAVASAHAAHVVHRDIKPSNVFVDARGNLKVLDFGIAKLNDDSIGSETTKTISLTPEYAAPEQFRGGDSTPLLDVFALGVLLGELLTGIRVRDGLLSRSVRDGNLPLPRGVPRRIVLSKLLRGDLDAIAAKATASDTTDRYASVSAFASDLSCFLSGHPVAARAQTRWYRLKKSIRRQGLRLSVSLAAIFLVLLSIGFATWQALSARHQDEKASAIQGLASRILDGLKPESSADSRPTRERILNRMSAELDATSDLDQKARAELDRRLGETWEAIYIGPTDTTLDRREAERLAADQTSPPSRERFQALVWLARSKLADPNEPLIAAQPFLEEALEVGREVYTDDSYELLSTRSRVGLNLYNLWRIDEALAVSETLLPDLERVLGKNDIAVVNEEINLHRLRLLSGEYEEPEAYFRTLLSQRAEWAGPGKARREHAVEYMLGEARRFRGDYVSAYDHLRRAGDLWEQSGLERDGHWINDRAHLVEFMLDRGDIEAAATLVPALEAWHESQRSGRPVEHLLPALALFHLSQGTVDAQLEMQLLQTLPAYEREYGVDGFYTGLMQAMLGRVRAALGNHQGAIDALNRANVPRHGLKFLHARLDAQIDSTRASLALTLGKESEALQIQSRLVERLTIELGSGHPMTAEATLRYAAACRGDCRLIDKEAVAAAVLTIRSQFSPASKTRRLADHIE